MPRDQKRHAGSQGLAGAKAPQGKRVAHATPAKPHLLPAERTLFLHLIRALGREAARADHDSDPGLAKTHD
jgi:hypothetical protein